MVENGYDELLDSAIEIWSYEIANVAMIYQ